MTQPASPQHASIFSATKSALADLPALAAIFEMATDDARDSLGRAELRFLLQKVLHNTFWDSHSDNNWRCRDRIACVILEAWDLLGETNQSEGRMTQVSAAAAALIDTAAPQLEGGLFSTQPLTQSPFFAGCGRYLPPIFRGRGVY